MLKESSSFLPASPAQQQNAQHSVQRTAGSLRDLQAVFKALAVF